MKNWSLLLAPAGILIAGLGVLYLKAHPAVGRVTPDMILGLSYLPWLAAVIIVSLVIQAILVRHKMDACLFPIVMTLASVGVVEIARLKPSLLVPQLRWLLIAMFLMVVLVRLWGRVHRLLEYPYILGICCVIVLFLPLLSAQRSAAAGIGLCLVRSLCSRRSSARSSSSCSWQHTFLTIAAS